MEQTALSVFRKISPDFDVFLRVICFSEKETQCLEKMVPWIMPNLPVILEKFYIQLKHNHLNPDRLFAQFTLLNEMQLAWLKKMFLGDYISAYHLVEENINLLHMRRKDTSMYVNTGFSFLRTEISMLITGECLVQIEETHQNCTNALMKLLSLGQFIVERAYFNSMIKTMTISRTFLDKLMKYNPS